MKRALMGKYNIIGVYTICNTKALFVLSWDLAKYWEDKKGNDAIALCWNGKLHFRQLYYRKENYCFKFFNHVIYLSEIERTEGTYDYVVL